MRLINTILELIFPSSCVNCRKSGEYLCDGCANTASKAERENLEWIYSVYDYRDPVIKKLLWLLKYKGRKAIAATVAKIVYDIMLEELAERQMIDNWQNPVLIPIPLSQRRLRERGFNQTALIARELVRLDKNQNFELQEKWLLKIKDTPRQAHIKNRQDRLRNLKGSLGLAPAAAVSGRYVILIDDVTTTGATLSEARRALRAAGARGVIAFTLAH